MDSVFKEFLSSGKSLLVDTKQTRAVMAKESKKHKDAKADLLASEDPDPHKRFIRRVIKDKPSKKEVIEQFQRFIDSAEACL